MSIKGTFYVVTVLCMLTYNGHVQFISVACALNSGLTRLKDYWLSLHTNTESK